MPTFAYAGRTRGGETVTGERAAETMDAVVAALRREQVLVTHPTHRERLDDRAERAQGLDFLTQERMRDRRVPAHDVREPRRWILRFVAVVRDGRGAYPRGEPSRAAGSPV